MGLQLWGGGASSETNQLSSRPVPPAWPSRTPYKSVPQRSGSETWKPFRTNERSSATLTFGSSFDGAAAGGAWASLWGCGWGEHLLRPINGPLARCHLPGLHGLRTSPCHKDRGQRHGSLPEPVRGSSRSVLHELTSPKSYKSKPAPYRHVEPSPTPEVRQTSAFPSVWSPSTARKVTKKN